MFRDKNKNRSRQEGFTPHHFLMVAGNLPTMDTAAVMSSSDQEKRKNSAGFTLIELLVVIAIIALLASIALVAVANARMKSRDAKRLSDMTQMNTALGLYFNTYIGYPSVTTSLIPNFTQQIPSAPMPGDGSCAGLDYHTLDSHVPVNTYGTAYYYYNSGTAYLAADGQTTVYPDYEYFFCLGHDTGNFPAGLHMLTPEGVR